MNLDAWKAALPTPRHEDWKYTSLAALKEASLAHVDARPVIEVFAGGRADVRAGSPAAMSVDEDAFTALNAEHSTEHVHVEVTEHASVRLAHAAPAGAITVPRVHVDVHDVATATVFETFAGEGTSLMAPLTTLSLAPGAKVNYARLVSDTRGFHVGRVVAHVGAGATLAITSAALGGRVGRVRLDVVLEQGARLELSGLSLAGRGALVDHHTFVDHTATDGITVERFRNVADGGGRAVFTGRIVVRPHAARTDAVQQVASLLLDDDAIANARPQLEIFHDDVKCAHGAAIGRLNDDAMFYLRQRGLDESEARRLLVRAFASDVFEHADEHAREALDAGVDAWLAGLEVA